MPDRRSMSWRSWKSGSAIAVGLIAGVLLGVLLDQLALWIALGVVFGVLGEAAIAKNR